MSLRYPLIDTFWFTLAHECAHVLAGHGKDVAVIDVDLGKVESIEDQEKFANNLAAEFCIDQTKMLSFYSRKKPYFSERDLLSFSKKMNIHPGIVAGQIQKRSDRWSLFKKFQVNVRQIINSTAIVDGWGEVAPID